MRMYININNNNNNNSNDNINFASFTHNGDSPFSILTMLYTRTKTGDFAVLGTNSWTCSTSLRVWAIIDEGKRRMKVRK